MGGCSGPGHGSGAGHALLRQQCTATASANEICYTAVGPSSLFYRGLGTAVTFEGPELVCSWAQGPEVLLVMMHVLLLL